MHVKKIEKIVKGIPIQKADRHPATGKFVCLPFGSNTEALEFNTLDEVADYLRRNPKSGVRMNPDWSKISRNIFIDGVAL